MLNNTTLLAVSTDIGNIGDSNVKNGLGPFSNTYTKTIGEIGANFSGIISTIVGVLTLFAGIWFIIQFIIGAYKWISSGGEKQQVEEAKNHLTQAVVGLTIIVISYVLIGLVGTILGLDILNPQLIIPLLKP